MAASHALLERWAAWWAGTADSPIDELYRPDATVTLLGGDPAELQGTAAIAEQAARFAHRVPDRATVLRQVVDTGDQVVAEWLFTGRGAEDLVTMATRTVTWWVLEGGRIVDELRVLDWSERRILDDGLRAAAPDWSGTRRSQGWYRDFTERLLELVDFDPELARAGAYGPDGELDLLDAACTAAEGDEAAPGGAAARLRAVAGQERALAVRLADAVVLVGLDGSDRIVSERNFGGSWWPARGAPHVPRHRLG